MSAGAMHTHDQRAAAREDEYLSRAAYHALTVQDMADAMLRAAARPADGDALYALKSHGRLA